MRGEDSRMQWSTGAGRYAAAASRRDRGHDCRAACGCGCEVRGTRNELCPEAAHSESAAACNDNK